MILGGLVEVIHELEAIFDRLGLDRSYGGAIAYNYYAPPRFTQDIDLLILVPEIKIPRLFDELSARGWQHGPNDKSGLVLGTFLKELRTKPYLATIFCGGIRTELFVPWHPFHYRVLERSPQRDLEGRSIRIHSAEDLIVFKKIFDRPKDIGDIKAMLMTQKGSLDLGRLRSDAKLLLTGNSLQELEGLLSEYG